MSLPKNDLERAQMDKTLSLRIGCENVVSTACPECGVRFALLVIHRAGVWLLRCVECGWLGDGEPK